MGKKLYLKYWNTCIYNGKIWFSTLDFNGIFSIDCETLSLEFHGHIPFLEKEAYCAYSFCVCEGKNIFFPPNNSHNKLLVFDADSDSFRGVNLLPKESSEVYCTAWMINAVGFFWIFPKNLKHGIWRIDLGTLSIEKDVELEQVMAGLEYEPFIVKKGYDQIVILTSENELIEIHLQNKAMEKVKQFEKNLSIHRMYFDKGVFWLLQKDSTDILRWNPLSDILTKFTMLGEAKWIRKNKNPYAGLFFVEQTIYVLNDNLYDIKKIDLNKNDTNIYPAFSYPPGFHFIPGRLGNYTGAFSCCDRVGNYLFFHPAGASMLLVYDMENHTVKGKELVVSKEEFPFMKENIFYEIGNEDLDGFIKLLCD